MRPGVPDELIAADGSIRPVWHDLIRALTTMSPQDDWSADFPR
jgi:hypothetical protein